MAPSFDTTTAHRYFAAHCYNLTWELLKKTDRTPSDDAQLLQRCYASLWHWSQRDDETDENRSIGYWQLARVWAVLGNGEQAKQAAERCLHFSQNQPPFYQGYAHEAAARAAKVAGNTEALGYHLGQAHPFAAQVEEADDRAVLESDLAELSG